MMAMHGQTVNPDIYMPAVTFYLWAIVILGGASRIMGPVVGSVIFWFLLTFLDALLRQATTQGIIPSSILASSDVSAMRFVFVGLLLVLLMAFRPAGILGNAEEIRLSVR